MHFLTLFIVTIYLKYVKVDELTLTHSGTGYVTDIDTLAKEDGYHAYDVEEEEHEVHYMDVRIITKLEFRIAIKDRRRFWADGIVPYVLSKRYDLKEKSVILEGMEAFKRNTCIRFIPRTKELVYVLIQPTVGCSAIIGKFGKSNVNLSRGCYQKGIVIHELMHVIGFFHEQSRPDRDLFVKINYANIIERHKKNFDKPPKNFIQIGNTSYDYGSIMHYGPFTFAKDRRVQTVIPLQKGVEIGQREDFSKKDIEKINLFYNCKPQGRRRVKRHEKHEPDSQSYFNKQEYSLPVVVDSQYVEQRNSGSPSFPTDVRTVDFGPERDEGEYSLPNYAPIQNSRSVYHPAPYPGAGYSSEERRRSYLPVAYPKSEQAYQWPSYSAVEQHKIQYSATELPKIVDTHAEQRKVLYSEAEPPRSPYRLSYGSPKSIRPDNPPVAYRRQNYYRPTYAPEYPRPAYARLFYTTAEYRRPPYSPPHYHQVEYPSMYGYIPANKPYTQPFYEATTLTTDPVTESVATTITEQSTTIVTTIMTPTTDNTTPATETASVTNEVSTTLETTTPIETTTSASTVTETTTVISTKGTGAVVYYPYAKTLVPTSTVIDMTTEVPTSTVAETTTGATTEGVSTVPTSTQEITSTIFTTVETTNAETTTATKAYAKSYAKVYGPNKKYDVIDNKPKTDSFELTSRGMGGFVSDRDTHSIHYHRIRIFPNIQGRTALRDPTAFWSRGIVPYEFSDKYDDQEKGFLLEAMQEFKDKTCVSFIPRRNQASYIFVEPDVRCSATIGRVPDGVHRVLISEGCYLKGTIIHELMHTLGFVHEQNRPDRDQFVIVMFDNIIPDARKNFRKYTWEQVQDLGESYDYDSVMHYSNMEFAMDPDRPTLVPLQPGVMLGQRDGFSVKDLRKINKLYNCPSVEARKVSAKEVVTASPIDEFKKYFQSNIQRLFRNLLRAIQNFKPSTPKNT